MPQRLHTLPIKTEALLSPSSFLGGMLSTMEGEANKNNSHSLLVSPATSSSALQCPICHKVFSNSKAVARHKRTHSDERKYACVICSKAFKRQDHLNGHMRTHESKKQSSSDFGDKLYNNARSLLQQYENQLNDQLEFDLRGNSLQLDKDNFFENEEKLAADESSASNEPFKREHKPRKDESLLDIAASSLSELQRMMPPNKDFMQDSFDVFGSFVASELRSITDKDVLQQVKRKIQIAIFDGQDAQQVRDSQHLALPYLPQNSSDTSDFNVARSSWQS